MPITRGQAKEICTSAEMELVDASFRPLITKLSPARLRSKIVRTRRLQEKFQHLERRQQREGKETKSTAAREAATKRTTRKVRLFDETRARFEKRLAQLEAKEAAGEGASPGRAARRGGARQAAAERRKERRQARRELA